MKRMLLIFCCLLGLTFPAGAFGDWTPNAFDDAGKSTWEYKAVETMCKEGKSPAYDAGFFARDHISRYELAGVIADLLDHGKNLTEPEKENLDRMKLTYKEELASRGWHEKQAEKPKPLLEIHGDLRVRKTSGEDPDARARVGFTLPVGDQTTVTAGKTIGK